MIQEAINAAMHDIAKTGIAKLSRADLGGAKVNFRGIEAAMNEMCVILIRHKITVTPKYSDLTITERAKADIGKATRFATVKGSFTFAAPDNSNVVCECYGEAMDSGDKALTKAQSVAFRTALFQQFVVPTIAMDPEADPESDDIADVPEDAFKAAEQGMLMYQDFWKKLTLGRKKELEPWHDKLKGMAQAADTSGR